MGIILLLTLVVSTVFVADNEEFFDTAIEQMKDGAEWHYVGPQALDPTAKSIPGQVDDHEPYIIWKLKKEKNG